jgi:hypothetical protein
MFDAFYLNPIIEMNRAMKNITVTTSTAAKKE